MRRSAGSAQRTPSLHLLGVTTLLLGAPVRHVEASAAADVETAFVHPGVLIDAAQLAFASQQVKAGVQPFAETFETLFDLHLPEEVWAMKPSASADPAG